MNHTYIIAEAGVNHNGSLATALQLIDAAVEAKADAVKFQSFKAEALVSKNAAKAEYQIETTGKEESQFQMLKKLELDKDKHLKLIEYSKSKGIEFLSTPFDLASLKMLVQGFGINKIKIPSGEITNAPFLLEISRMSERIILSTGMSTLADIENALGVIAFGFLNDGLLKPSITSFKNAFASFEGQAELRKRVVILHATTEYPAPFEEVNLAAMDTIRNAFGLPVGYSDHTMGIHIPIAAVARGACIIEKHFTLDRKMEGPDHRASIEPFELKQMVQAIRDIEKAIGNGIKIPTLSELKNINIARKSIVAASEIREGDFFTKENLTTKRPGSGESPLNFWRYLGEKAAKPYFPDDKIL